VAKVNSDRIVYTSGLYARTNSDAAGEVTDIFEQLDKILKETGSDWKHLAKATYYCSNNDTSAKLNELRPKFYDPARPPAASKALVNGVGRAALGLTIDMIVVPAE
jgi:enamine deaminase RidA (YjgF/YER057c/UK114 family)